MSLRSSLAVVCLASIAVSMTPAASAAPFLFCGSPVLDMENWDPEHGVPPALLAVVAVESTHPQVMKAITKFGTYKVSFSYEDGAHVNRIASETNEALTMNELKTICVEAEPTAFSRWGTPIEGIPAWVTTYPFDL